MGTNPYHGCDSIKQQKEKRRKTIRITRNPKKVGPIVISGQEINITATPTTTTRKEKSRVGTNPKRIEMYSKEQTTMVLSNI